MSRTSKDRAEHLDYSLEELLRLAIEYTEQANQLEDHLEKCPEDIPMLIGTLERLKGIALTWSNRYSRLNTAQRNLKSQFDR